MNKYELENQIVMTSVKTLETLYKQTNGADAVSLYFFYYKTAKRQDTNQVRATEAYCRMGLNWGVKRFREAYKTLTTLKLVELTKSSGKWYIKINFYKSNSAKNSLVENEPNSAKKQLDAFQPPEMLNNNININAFTFTNVKDGISQKSPCPLTKNPVLKEKWPKGHSECVEYVTSFKFVNKGKQFKFLHQMLSAGLDFEDIDRVIARVQKKKFFQENGWDFASLAGEAERSSNAHT